MLATETAPKVVIFDLDLVDFVAGRGEVRAFSRRKKAYRFNFSMSVRHAQLVAHVEHMEKG